MKISCMKISFSCKKIKFSTHESEMFLHENHKFAQKFSWVKIPCMELCTAPETALLIFMYEMKFSCMKLFIRIFIYG